MKWGPNSPISVIIVVDLISLITIITIYTFERVLNYTIKSIPLIMPYINAVRIHNILICATMPNL